MRIYLSSTSVDLKPFRNMVLGALRRMGHEAAAMEDYGAEDQWPADKCVADVQASDLYIGVFAWRYGFIPAGRQFSVTEMEYQAAREKGIPTLIFVLDPEVAWPPKFIDRGEGAHRIEDLRDRLMKTHLVSMFVSPEDLAAKVATAVARVDSGQGKKGAAAGKPVVSWTIAELRARAQRASEDYFEKMERQRVYVPQIYVSRAELEGHLDTFAETRCSKTGLLIVGASGTGKTNTLCHWVRRYQADAKRPNDVLLFVGGSTLPGGHFDLRQAIMERLEVSGSFGDFLSAFGAQRGQSDTQLFLVIDSVDKHPQHAELMKQIDDLIVLEHVIPWYKVIVSIAEVPYANLRNTGFIPGTRDYYAAPGAPSGGNDEVMEVHLGLLSPHELAAAYQTYLKEPGLAPTSTFAELTDEVKLSLRKPLVLRIVMELFHGRKLPERVLGTEVLFEYCTKKIFRHPDRSYFVNRLVDVLYDHRITTASFDQLSRESDLRSSLLDSSPGSCFPQLLDEQVLEEQTKRVSAILPPQRSLAFTYDRLLEYLLLVRLVERFGMRPEALVKLTREAPGYLPLHGVLVTLLESKLGEGRADEVAVVLRDGEPQVARSLARRVFSEVEHTRPMPEGAAPDEGLLGALVKAMAAAPSPLTVELLLEAAAELQGLGYLRRAASIYQALAPVLPAELEPRIRSSFHRGLGMVEDLLGRNAEALKEFEAALRLCRQAGDRAEEQELLDDIGSLQLELGHPDEALKSLSASLDIDRELVANGGGAAAREGEAASLHGLADFYFREGRLDVALEHAQEALKLRRDLGARRWLADSVLQVAECQRRRRCFDEALAGQTEALSVYRELGSKLGVASCLGALGSTHMELGRRAEAGSCLTEALALFKEIGRIEGAAEITVALGVLAREAGEYDAAAGHFVDALQTYRSVGDPISAAARLIDIGSARLLAGKLEAAESRLREALSEIQQIPKRPGEARCIAFLAAATAQLGRKEEAVAFAEKAAESLKGKPPRDDIWEVVHFHRYQALKAAGREREADEALGIAHESLLREASHIRSEEERKAYLGSSRLRRDILEARSGVAEKVAA
ncbi:MAG: tetratricopeptide repeat protein [Elusimicrobia bacterium]|nr:tetratricopeptide repeat protein [Elusimicrobiota bacterium]